MIHIYRSLCASEITKCLKKNLKIILTHGLTEHQKNNKNSTYAQAIRRLLSEVEKFNIHETKAERDSLKMTLKMKNKQFL